MTPKLSVLMPARNAAATIRLQLDALSGQTWNDHWELLVADNGSTDETRSIVESYAGRIPGLRIVDASERASAPFALNRAVAASRAPSLAFCDADDEVAPDWVERMWEAITRDGFVACRLELERLNPRWLLEHRELSLVSGLDSSRFPPYLAHGASCGLGILRRHWDLVGGFHEVVALYDTDLCFRAQLAGIPLSFAPDALVYYRLRPDLRGIYRQARNYAECDADLQRRYGTTRGSLGGVPRWAVSYWRAVARQLPAARSRAGRARLAWLLGWQIGRYRGSFRYRILAR